MIPVPPGAGGAPLQRPRLTITVPTGAAELVAAWLHLRSDGGLEVRDGETGGSGGAAAPGGVVQLVLWPPYEDTPALVFGLAEVFTALRRAGTLSGSTLVEIDEDPGLWERPWQVVRIAGRFVVARPWVPYAPADGELLVVVDPGPGADDGRQPATALALLQLHRLEEAGVVFDRVLDVACGSGVVSLAAAQVWPAASVVAVDADERVAAVGRRNVAAAGRSAQVDVRHGPATAVEGTFGLAVVRGSAGEQGALAPVLERVVVPGGRVIASGFPVGARDAVERTFAAFGFYCAQRDELDDWLGLTLVK